MKLSICVFIKDNNACGFGLWESMAQLMPLADEFFVLDLGSQDGTYQNLKWLAERQPKIRLEQSEFKKIDAGVFADLPNEMIPTCRNDLVMYYQADEIFHETLLAMLQGRLQNGVKSGFMFWRYQLKHNFQQIKWFPHIVHRIGFKSEFVFRDDGMNTEGMNGELLSNYDGGWFTRWGAEFKDCPVKLPTYEMILDISNLGGFLNNVRNKTNHHAPFWKAKQDDINVGGHFKTFDDWYAVQKNNPEWTATDTPFNIPKIVRPLLGKTTYPGLREELKHKIIS